mmetsp:Transcript_9502/g.14329  ORF Transcript_9502/g.14329 Transcript_9502/m.14329 type:complete len:117 (-) Transcript_9502:122-472(-)
MGMDDIVFGADIGADAGNEDPDGTADADNDGGGGYIPMGIPIGIPMGVPLTGGPTMLVLVLVELVLEFDRAGYADSRDCGRELLFTQFMLWRLWLWALILSLRVDADRGAGSGKTC